MKDLFLIIKVNDNELSDLFERVEKINKSINYILKF